MMLPVKAAPLLLLRGGIISSLRDAPPINVQLFMADQTLRMGTMLGAISGVITGGVKQMDLFGCLLVGCIGGLGGGTFRDLLLARKVFWLHSNAKEYMPLCLIVSLVTFFVWPHAVRLGVRDTHLAFLWADALSMGACVLVGSQVGLQVTQDPLFAVLSGCCTAIGGGIARDLLCLEPPRALYNERSMYATPALLGAAVFVVLSILSRDWPISQACRLSQRASWTARHLTMTAPSA